MVKLKKKLRKASKKAKNSAKKVANTTTQEVKDTAQQTTNTVVAEVKEASAKVSKYGGKTFNQVTGAIEDTVDKAIDYTTDDLKTAVNYAEKKWKQGADWVEDLAKDAINAAYRAVYKECVGDYGKFVAALIEAQTKIFTKDVNILTKIRDDLFKGQFSSSMDDLAELLASEAMKKPVEIGHKLFGTSFIVAADLSVGATKGFGTAGASGTVGLTYMLDHYNAYKHKACVFAAAGGAIGASTPSKKVSISGELGISLGFLAEDPTNISGWFVDVGGQGDMGDNASAGLGLSWSPPGKKPPYVKPIPAAGVTRLAASKSWPPSNDPNASATIGGSYTWIIQKIKNDLYTG